MHNHEDNIKQLDQRIAHLLASNHKRALARKLIEEIQKRLQLRIQILIAAIHHGRAAGSIDFVLNAPLGYVAEIDLAYQYPDAHYDDTNLLVKPIAIDVVLDCLCQALTTRRQRAERVEMRSIDLSLGHLRVDTLNRLLAAGIGQFSTTRLVLSHNPTLGQAGIFRLRDAILSEQAFPHLRTLDVRGNALDKASLEALSQIREFLGLTLLTDDDLAPPGPMPPNVLPQHTAAQRPPAAPAPDSEEDDVSPARHCHRR